VGGTEILVTLHNFPKVNLVMDAQVVFDDASFGDLYLTSSSEAETHVRIHTPAVDMYSMAARTVTAQVCACGATCMCMLGACLFLSVCALCVCMAAKALTLRA
jgi:hypothetical protein